MATKRFHTCSKDCYGACCFFGEWDDTKTDKYFIKGIPVKDHPFTKGFFCPKLSQRENLIYHPDRLTKPLIRTGKKPSNSIKEDLKQIDLSSALTIASDKINSVIQQFGAKSILCAFYSGNSGLISMYSPLRFFKAIEATITTDGICNEGGCAGLQQMFGTYSTTNPFQLTNEHVNLIVVWGSNLSESNNHAYQIIKGMQSKGVKLVVLDNRKTKIAEEADLFINIFPGMDNIIAKQVLYELNKRGEFDLDFLAKHCSNYQNVIDPINLKGGAIPYELKEIYPSTSDISAFVDLLVKYKHNTIFNIGYGVQKDRYGGRMVQAAALIQVVLGNLGKQGTGIIYSQSDFNRPYRQPVLDFITGDEMFRGNNSPRSNQKSKEIPLIKLAEELNSAEYKLLFIYNFNPATSLPDLNQLYMSFLKKDLYIIVHDMFLTATTQFADLIIPAKFDLETYDIISSYYIPGFSINEAGPCPHPNCISNYDLFASISKRVKMGNNGLYNLSEQQFYIESLKRLPNNIQKGLKTKKYYLLQNLDDVPYQSLQFPTQFKDNPNDTGKIDLSNLNLNLSDRLPPSLPKNLFRLITPSHQYLLHSQLGLINAQKLQDFDYIFVNPNDIIALKYLGIREGDIVKIYNELGTGIYKIKGSPMVGNKTAMIYSGLHSHPKSIEPQQIINSNNANIFTPAQPEELGLSGAYNSAYVMISSIEKQ
jgi:anaerobic selenocysteine-containing dehydrogenase